MQRQTRYVVTKGYSVFYSYHTFFSLEEHLSLSPSLSLSLLLSKLSQNLRSVPCSSSAMGDLVGTLQSAISLAQKCYSQYKQMATNAGSADILGARFNLIENLLRRVQQQPELIETSRAAIERIEKLLTDGAALANDVLAAKGSS